MSRIRSCASYVPSNVVTNQKLSEFVNTSDEWITQRTGIKQRHFLKDENNLDMATKAVLKAIDRSGIDKEEVDAIIFSTCTPDRLIPSMASSLKKRIGIQNTELLAFDVNAACSGFMVALECANYLLKSYKNVCVVASEAMSTVLDWQDRSTCVLFGDGAGAIILSRSENEMKFHSYSEHDEQDSLISTNLIDGACKLIMKGSDVFRFAVRALETCILKECEEAGCSIDDIDYIIAHQANHRIIQYVCRQLNIPESKFYMNVDEVGNTSSASIPILISKMIDEKVIQKNQTNILVAFGAGLTYSSCLWKVEEELR